MGASLTQGILAYLRPDSLSTLTGLNVQDLFSPQRSQETTSEQNQTVPASGKLASGDVSDGLSPNKTQCVESQFNAIAYVERVEQLRIAARFQQQGNTAASGVGTGNGDLESAANQLTFNFSSEVRVEALARFEQRVGAVAEDLSGERQQTFLAASQEVRVRFEMSAQLSGVVLDGFATAAEGVKDNETALDRLLALTEGLQHAADDVTEKIFELLDGLFKGADGFNDLFDALFQEISQMFQGLAGSQDSTSGSQGQTFAMNIQLEFEFTFSASIQISQEGVQQSDPIMFDLDGDGFELTHYSDGAKFDILGSGQQVTTAFVTGGDAFLAIDRNGNGSIDSGLELFGDQRGARNGFEELRKLDSNGDGLINDQDADFAKLRLFRDNGNGKTEAGELISLADAGIQEISLTYADVNQRAAGANRIAQTAWYRRVDGTKGHAADAVLNYTV